MTQPVSRSGKRPAGVVLVMTLAMLVQGAFATTPPVTAAKPSDGLLPGIHYEDARAHADDRIDFDPGGRVNVGFTPRPNDAWKVDGKAPQALPAGRLNGRQLREQGKPKPVEPKAAEPKAAEPTPGGTALPTPEPPSDASGSEPSRVPGDDDQPVADPSAAVEAVNIAWRSEEQDGPSAPAAAVSSTGLRREVFGFLPYWELSDSSTRIDYSKVSTIAYFGVGIAANGSLMKRNSDGTTTVGWSGWTSSRMTTLINTAHQNRTRVVLTVQSFAWTSGQLDRQKRFLGSSTARATLARQVAVAVRDRGADGVNLDLEPLARGYEDEFTALVRRIRAELNNVRSGYQLTFDTTGHIGNYPIEAATAAGGADAIIVMGYDYRTAGSSPVGSIAPLSRTGYDIRDTIAAYRARVPASKLILGVPYYGRAWSTDSDDLHASNISGTKYGASTTVPYDTAITYTAEHGRRYDATEGVAWTAYRRENCTDAYGCVTPWRQLYFDDGQALRAKYDLVNRNSLRGVGIWALGYDGSRTELWTAIADKFAPDTRPPVVGIRNLGASQPNPSFTVSWTGTDASGIASYDLQVSINGSAWKPWRNGTTVTSRTYFGREGEGYAFRVRARDVKGNTSAWLATSRWDATPPLAGGFGRVTVDGLSLRASASASAAKVGAVNTGDILVATGGPVSSGGYVWYRVSGPLREWGSVGAIQKNVWVAARNSSTRFVVAAHGPHTTFVRPVIAKLGFAGAGSGSIGTSSAAVEARSFSPNGDGSKDSVRISWTNSRTLDDLELRVFRSDGALVGTVPLAGGRLVAGAHSYAWDGSLGGSRLADGRYFVTLVGVVGASTYSNPSPTLMSTSQLATHALQIDVARPDLAASADPVAFSPNGDGYAEKTSLRWTSDEPLTGRVTVRTGTTVVRSWSFAGETSRTIAWDGRSSSGTVVHSGTYTLRVDGRDRAGNAARRETPVVVDRTLRNVARTPSRFFALDGDELKRSTRLTFRLTRSARVSLEVLRGSTVVRTAYSGRSLAAGSYGWTWNGRDASGAYVPRGSYTLRLSVTSPVSTTVRKLRVLADAFRISLSATTRSPGQSLSVTAWTTEPLEAAPRMSLTQHGAAAVTKTAVRLSTGAYRATFTIASGAPGTATIRVFGTDTLGGKNRSYATMVVK